MLALVFFLSCSDPGFGGADDGSDPVVVEEEEAAAAVRADEFKGGATPSTTPSTTLLAFPAPQAPPPPKLTQLEQQLAKARLDPANYPLLQLRVDVARLEESLVDLEGRGLTAARDIEPKLAQARALLSDAERIAVHRMNMCLARRGLRQRQVKNCRMTPGGPVPLTNAEIMAQTSPTDPDGCLRSLLVDQAVVDHLKRAHEVNNTLATVNFSYHRVAERYALEEELKGLMKQLATEDLLALTLADTGR